jgi:hypothetical protein
MARATGLHPLTNPQFDRSAPCALHQPSGAWCEILNTHDRREQPHLPEQDILVRFFRRDNEYDQWASVSCPPSRDQKEAKECRCGCPHRDYRPHSRRPCHKLDMIPVQGSRYASRPTSYRRAPCRTIPHTAPALVRPYLTGSGKASTYRPSPRLARVIVLPYCMSRSVTLPHRRARIETCGTCQLGSMRQIYNRRSVADASSGRRTGQTPSAGGAGGAAGAVTSPVHGSISSSATPKEELAVHPVARGAEGDREDSRPIQER